MWVSPSIDCPCSQEIDNYQRNVNANIVAAVDIACEQDMHLDAAEERVAAVDVADDEVGYAGAEVDEHLDNEDRNLLAHLNIAST